MIRYIISSHLLLTDSGDLQAVNGFAGLIQEIASNERF